MPLVKCVDCGTDVSSEAASCPKCARPITAAPATSNGKRIGGVIIGLALIALNFSGVAVFFRFDLAIIGVFLCLAAIASK